jgi:CRISPR-associated protein Cmr6
MSYGNYLLPTDTAQLAKKYVGKCQNFGLTLQRYAPKEAIFETNRQNDKGHSIGKERNFWLQDICRDFMPDSEMIKGVHQRWLATTEGAARFTMIARSRLIIGLGGKGALEFGITLHPVTGLPYIPGSALKGLCRNYTLYHVAEQYIAEQSGVSLDHEKVETASDIAQRLDEQLSGVKDHGLKLNPEWADFYQKLFGTQGEAGHCVFYDAVVREIPNNTSLFAVEVMTPHFRKYYESSGATPPYDADDPKPVTYIAVNTGILFQFAVGRRKNAPPDTPFGDARTLLREALRVMGIGAKTAAGYGIFKPVESKKK